MKTLFSLGLAANLFAACAALAQPPVQDDSIKGAFTQPLKDIGVVRTETPEALNNAAKTPYDNIDASNCPAMFAEIKDLDTLLGPDVDDPSFGAKSGGLASAAVRGAVHVPFSGVVRRLSGAQKRDDERQRAITAGIARRAYLKGAITGCDKPGPAAPPPILVPTLAPEPAKPAVEAAKDVSATSPDPGKSAPAISVQPLGPPAPDLPPLEPKDAGDH